MEKIYSWLFGETKWQQEKKLKKLLCLTAVFGVLILIELLIRSAEVYLTAGLLIMIWGWSFVSAAARTVCRVIVFFNSDIAILILTVITWMLFGIFGGILSLILGVIRYIQLRKER